MFEWFRLCSPPKLNLRGSAYSIFLKDLRKKAASKTDQRLNTCCLWVMFFFLFLVNGFLSIRHLLCLCHVPVSPVRIRQSLCLFMIFPSHVCVYSFSFSCLFSFVHVFLCHFLSCLYLSLVLCLALSFISVMSVYHVCYCLPTSSCMSPWVPVLFW